jgi:hypothetical protein
VAYLAISFALGFMWHLRLLRPIYARLAIQGAVLAYLYPLVMPGASPATEGLAFGLLMGAFIASSAVIAEAAKQRVSSLGLWLAVEGLYYLIQFSLVGLAIGLIYGVAGGRP